MITGGVLDALDEMRLSCLQKQASEALEAAKAVYAQLAEERERADHDLETARQSAVCA